MKKKKIILVSGNLNKINEFKEILDVDYEVENVKLELEEIQSMSVTKICKDKAEKAFSILKVPLMVEDTGFFIDELNGLPGPFIKYFEERLGNGAAIKLLGNSKNRKAKQVCAICYYDGKNLILEEAVINGNISYELKEGEGFGFDFCFVPEGYDKTFSQLGLNEKNKISARKKVIDKLRKRLEHIYKINI